MSANKVVLLLIKCLIRDDFLLADFELDLVDCFSACYIENMDRSN